MNNKWILVILGSLLICGGLFWVYKHQQNNADMLEAQKLAVSWQKENLEILGSTILIIDARNKAEADKWGVQVADRAQRWVVQYQKSPTDTVVIEWFRETTGKQKIYGFDKQWIERYRRSVNWWYLLQDTKLFSEHFKPHLPGYRKLRLRLRDEGHSTKTIEEESLEYIIRTLEIYED